MIPFPKSSVPEISYTLDEDIPTLRYNNRNPSVTTTTANVISKTYETNTYIDWNHETLAIAHHSPTYMSRKWITIAILAILMGYSAAAIQLISVNLDDFKKGVCLSKADTWSLLNPYLTCPTGDWYDWARFFFDSKNWLLNWIFNFPIYLTIAGIFAIIALHITLSGDTLIKQSGISEIKLIISGFNLNIGEYLGLKALLSKVVALILVVSSGMWLGKEGPLVHVSCCIFNVVYSLTMRNSGQLNEAVRREILSAATATGISVAFDSPIGGVLFVLESMPAYFMPTKIMWNSFISATVAVVILTGFRLFTDGRNFLEQDLFQVNFGNFSWLFLEIVPFVFLGVLGGFYGHFLIRVNDYVSTRKFRRPIQNRLCELLNLHAKWGKYLEISLVVIITTILSFPFAISKLPMNAYLKLLFKDCTMESDSPSSDLLCLGNSFVTVLKLLFILLQGFFLTAYSYGLDIPGGILLPSLVLGATTGRALGIVSQWLQGAVNWDSLATCTEKSCLVSPSSYAVVGAAAFTTGVTKLTMCVVVIMFEMTGAVTYVLPIMCAVMTSKFVNDWLCSANIYDNFLQNKFNQADYIEETKGYWNEGKGSGLASFSTLTTTRKAKLPDITIKDLMVPLRNMRCLSLIPSEGDNTIDSLYKLVNNDNHEGYPLIVNYDNPIYLGYVSKLEITRKLSQLEGNPNLIVSIQVENLPNNILSMQLHYERSHANSDFIQLDLNVEKQMIITNQMTPAVLILEEIEKLFLNYLVITEKNNLGDQLMCGFIDRYCLAHLIGEEFKDLQGSEFAYISGYDENHDEYQHLNLADLRINRKSIELIT